MENNLESSSALNAMMDALHWAYEKAVGEVPVLGGASKLADDHLKSCGQSPDKAIDDLITWQMGYAGTVGFVANLGGIITMPVSIPANIASNLFIQLRMIAAIARLRGYEINDEQVRTLAYICLAGSAAGTKILKEAGVNAGMKFVNAQILKNVSGAMLININKAVGFRLFTKAGSTGVINLTKTVPFVGGLIAGAFDASTTYGIGVAAKQAFNPIAGSILTPESSVPDEAAGATILDSEKQIPKYSLNS